MAQEQLVLRGTMRAHTDWVTTIATPTYGVPRRRLTGHSHFVEDVVLSSDGQFALSGSWDIELRLWDLQAGTTARRFVGHTKDVLSVAFSINNCQIVSAFRDKTIKLWTFPVELRKAASNLDGFNLHLNLTQIGGSSIFKRILEAKLHKALWKSEENLRAAHGKMGVGNRALENVMDKVRNKHYQLACTLTFEAVHGTSCDAGINHPNQYFTDSKRILESRNNSKSG